MTRFEWSLAPLPLLAAALLVAPGTAMADRGALTLDAGGFGAIASLPPPVGTGNRVTGTSFGGLLSLRYAPASWLEVTASGFYEAPATYFHAGTTFSAAGVPFTGTLRSRDDSWGISTGARYVHGLLWRFFAGLELGFAHRAAGQLDLIDMSDPANPRSYGLTLPDMTATCLLVAPVAGLEWSVSDHVTLGLSPRLHMYLGDRAMVEVLFPVTVSYSWYLF